MHHSLISTKGQVVIPQTLRERYHLNPNTRASWIDTGNALLLVPSLKNAHHLARGLLKGSRFTQNQLKKDRQIEKKAAKT